MAGVHDATRAAAWLPSLRFGDVTSKLGLLMVIESGPGSMRSSTRDKFN